MHQRKSYSGASPALDVPGNVGGLRPPAARSPAGLDVGVNYAFGLRPCQMTPSARRSIHPTSTQVH